MKRVLLLLLCLAAAANAAQQPVNVGSAPNDGTGDTARTAFQKLNANDVEEYVGVADLRGQRVYNVTDYGAECDGTTDDATAWNNAITAAKAAANISGSPMTTRVVGCQGQSLVKSTLNFSGINSPVPTAFTVDMSGTCLLGETNGLPVIDAMGSKMIRWEHLCIKGMSTLTPNVGVQWGRLSTGATADQFYWDHPVVEGFFTFAAAYNQASEDNTYIAPRFTNATTTGTTFGLVMDGYAYWTTSPNVKVISASQTLKSSITAFSFIGETFIGGNIVSNNTTSSGASIWTGQTSQHHYHGTYVNSDGAYNVVLYCGTAASGGVNKNLVFDVHTEGVSVTSTFLLTGGQVGACNLYNFGYVDNENFASASVFAIDGASAVTSAVFQDASIKIDTFFATPTVFDTPASYKYSGFAYVPTSTPWNTPANFSGTLCYASRCDSYSNPTGAQNVAVGPSALGGASLSGNFNTAFGLSVLATDGTGGNNTGVGYAALTATTSGATNAAVGSISGEFISSGAGNTAIGYGALTGITGAKTTGNNNTAVGQQALNNVQGAAAGNTGVGSLACGATLTTGTNNICIGASADTLAPGTSNEINIGNILFYNSVSTAAPLLSSCGTGSPTVDANGNNASGTITAGAGALASCTLTFAGGGYTSWNHCQVTSQSVVASFAYTYSKTVITVTGTSITSDKFDYQCQGY